ncbi:MAG: DUF2029 domain-containing protein [Chloroflexi bacterium]|nr:DUF2029 domain-containing protein [Chloroflexota bacterium]
MQDPAGAYIPAHKRAPASPARPDPPPWRQPVERLGLFAIAVIGGLLGLGVLWIHLTNDPLADARAYYDAARRLNEGLPLYPAQADPNAADFYRYPPLLAIVLRPFALLPYHVFALGWASVVLASFVVLVRRLRLRRRVLTAIGILGIPIAWALSIAQVHVPLTLLMLIGQPWSIALAANLKLVPILAAAWWIGRRQWQAVGVLAIWMVLLGLAQYLVEPAGSIAFIGTLSADQVGQVNNLSPFAISPILWFAALGVGMLVAIGLAPTKWGWPAAVALATLAYPRLLLYMLTSLLAALREPDPPRGIAEDDGVPDAATAYVASAR